MVSGIAPRFENYLSVHGALQSRYLVFLAKQMTTRSADMAVMISATVAPTMKQCLAARISIFRQ
jgi:hypothetical protein